MSLPREKMRGELKWIGWVSGSTLLQGTKWAWSYLASLQGLQEKQVALSVSDLCESIPLFELLKGMGSVNSPAHTQEDWVDSNLCTLELFAPLNRKSFVEAYWAGIINFIHKAQFAPSVAVAFFLHCHG
eukprot:1138054-Pelagomonas_calceolata.AAC.1